MTDLPPATNAFPRPFGHPPDKPWPPIHRVYPEDHPARSDEESKTAFNEDWAREDFGNDFVDMLVNQYRQPNHRQFAGDWWMLAVLLRVQQSAESVDPEGNEQDRFLLWNSLLKHMESSFVYKHLEGGNFAFKKMQYAYFNKTHLENSNFTHSTLDYSDLYSARLTHAVFAFSRLRHGNLWRAHLENASFDHADLSDASFSNANLKYANLWKARLERSWLERAQLDYANLLGAALTSADMREATLTGSDVRQSVGLRFDSNRVRDIRIEGNAPDPWSVLRRNYTGPMFFIHFALLITFVLPYIGRVLALSAADHAGQLLTRAANHLPQVVPITVERIPAWRVLLGFDQAWWVPTLASVLLLYNILRAILTIKVGQLRDAEERSGISPRLVEYMGTQRHQPEHYGTFLVALTREFVRWLFRRPVHDDTLSGDKLGILGFTALGLWRLHRLLNLLLIVALASFVFHAAHWIGTATVPKLHVAHDASPTATAP